MECDEKACFNSKMVRLKEVFEKTKGRCGYWFQFQNGAIKSKRGKLQGLVFTNVSIPKWCD